MENPKANRQYTNSGNNYVVNEGHQGIYLYI